MAGPVESEFGVPIPGRVLPGTLWSRTGYRDDGRPFDWDRVFGRSAPRVVDLGCGTGDLAFACLEPFFFIGYLISIALFGLYQAIFMANAGGAWDNAKKWVEVELNEKGTPLHAATVVGDTVGDPFKDTSSVAMNPIIKFTTLFGLLAVEMAIELNRGTSRMLAAIFFALSLIFVWRSFYAMRIPVAEAAAREVRKSATGGAR